MENRNANVLVGSVAFILIIALFGFFLWLSKFSGEARNEYDIFFSQSVAGLTVGSSVSFSGVPVGQVSKIALMPETPKFVRVRIRISQDVPVLEGTTATLQGVGFTGVAEIQLSGAVPDAPRISHPGPYGVPVIPSQTSGFSHLMETAPEVMERASMALARLNDILDQENREKFAKTLANLDEITAILADQGPELKKAITAATDTLQSIDKLSVSTKELLEADGKPVLNDLRDTLQAAQVSLRDISKITRSAEPGVRTLSSDTIPQANRLLDELQGLTERLGAVASKLDEDPLDAVLGGRTLPDYDGKEIR